MRQLAQEEIERTLRMRAHPRGFEYALGRSQARQALQERGKAFVDRIITFPYSREIFGEDFMAGYIDYVTDAGL